MTHFSWPIDGSIVGLYLLATMVAGLMVRRYVAKVDDFLVAGREMNVYLGIASLAATEFGIVTCMYAAQNGYKTGLPGPRPESLRRGDAGRRLDRLLHQTAARLERHHHSRTARQAASVRAFAGWPGVVIVLGGLLNMGVFLRTGGDFLVLVCDFSPTISIGGLEVETIVVMMTVLLVGVATYTILGGMLSVLITDFLQFVVMSVGLIVVTVLILVSPTSAGTGWWRPSKTHYGAGGFNPFVNPNMGWSYVVFNLLVNTAAVLTWQTAVARVLAAKDSNTGMKVYTRTSFFFVCRFLIPGIWGIAALAVLGPHVPDGNPLLCDAEVSGRLRARRADGHSDRRHAGRRHEHRLLLHAHLGERDLQRHSAAVPQDRLVREERAGGQPLHRRRHRRLSLVLRPVVQSARRSVELFDGHRLDLPDEHVHAADRRLLLEAGKRLGGGRSDRARRRRARGHARLAEGRPLAAWFIANDSAVRNCGLCVVLGGDDRGLAAETAGERARSFESDNLFRHDWR